MIENKESIEALLPEISLIKDEELRQKTMEIWWEAIKEGGWRVADLERIPFTLLISGTEINLITHVRAVTLCSLRLAETIEHFYPGVISVNRDIVLAGAILHDVGKLLEIQDPQPLGEAATSSYFWGYFSLPLRSSSGNNSHYCWPFERRR